MALSQSVYLAAMGIQSWHLKQPKVLSNSSSNEPLAELCTIASHCTACVLYKTRTQTVFGSGNPQADLMLIGDAPGFYDDRTGEPFAGHAGQLLNSMLYAIGLEKQSVYSTTLLKCRLPDNRSPSPEEINQCILFLNKQIALIQPKVLLVFGSIAAQHLLNTQSPLEQLRGNLYSYGTPAIPLIATYHPAHLLLNPQDKNKTWKDLQMVYGMLSS